MTKQRPPRPAKSRSGDIADADLERVTGGTDSVSTGQTVVVVSDATSDIMKTKHDTVKNSISNVR
jgi:hypothetical protein